MKKYIRAASGDDAEYTEWLSEIQNTAGYKQLQSAATRFGYDVVEATIDNKGRITCRVRPVDKYHPDIYILNGSGVGLATSDDISVKIQTTSFGSLDLTTYRTMLQACNDAAAFAEFLMSWDKWDQLYEYTPE